MSRMQWSKLKTRVKDRICPELKGRVDFYLTSYRRAHDDADTIWVTVDGERIFEVKYYAYQKAAAEYYADQKAEGFFSALPGNAIRGTLSDVEIFSPQDFGRALRSYLDLSIHDALASTNPLIKAFAIIDRRVGKRTLAKLEIADSEHLLVKTFYSLASKSHPR